MKNKLSIFIALVMLLTALLAGCKPAAVETTSVQPTIKPAEATKAPESTKAPEATKPPEPTKAPEPVTVTFWKAPHSEKEAEIWKGIIADFEAANPTIKIEHVITPWDTWDEKFTAGFASDTPPDVSYMVDWWSAKYALNNQFVDLDAAGWSNEIKSGFDPSVWAIPNINGKQYGVPILLVPRLMFYNKDLFAAAGLPEPTNDWNWAQFLETAKALTKDDQFGFVFPGTFAGRGYQDFLGWLYSAGGQMLSDDGTKAAFNSEAGKAALQFVVDMFIAKVVPPSGQYDDVSQEDLFMRGKVGMTVMRALAISQIRKDYPDLKFGLVLPPKGATGQFAFADWGYYAIAERSKVKDAAWTWVKYITSKEIASLYLKEVGLFPARNDTGLFADDPVYQKFIEYTPHEKGIPIHPKIQEVFQLFWSEAEKAILGQITVEEALATAETLVNEALSK
jgi:multiple sugar transport system substrate-binding protein